MQQTSHAPVSVLLSPPQAMLQRSSLLWLAVLICTWKYGEAQNSPPIFGVVIDSVSFLEFEEEDASESLDLTARAK